MNNQELIKELHLLSSLVRDKADKKIILNKIDRIINDIIDTENQASEYMDKLLKDIK